MFTRHSVASDRSDASRAAFGQSFAEAQRENAEIWSRMSEVAGDNESAWLRKAVSADEIATPSPQNRPIAFPYTKLMVANASVNQGAGSPGMSGTRLRAELA